MHDTTESDPATPSDARRHLRTAGAQDLPPRPWQHPAEPPDAATLLRYALWRANRADGAASPEELKAALTMIETARSDLDSLEVALLLTARAEGMTWAEVAEALGLQSPQAAQQRYQRVSQRPMASDPDGHDPA
ncbi:MULTISPECIES: hypothetical protein [unclassified Brachybacterium]|uniref:hypothetical protein n=1 Tax=unclassified Brachybacterium TaxID=2623841 RepID=UPI00402B031D